MVIAVGTALAGGPPHRSQRALLTHWAPALGPNAKTHIGKGMHDTGGRQPSVARRFIRFQLIRVRWLRRSSARCQCHVTWVRNAATAVRLPGTA